jgi:hypothetical protein
VGVRVTVLDKDLRAWRLRHPRQTVFPASRLPPFVCNTMLGSVEAGLGSVECSGLRLEAPAPRAVGLDQFATGVRERVMPVLELFRS